jgi:hypothetical protein
LNVEPNPRFTAPNKSNGAALRTCRFIGLELPNATTAVMKINDTYSDEKPKKKYKYAYNRNKLIFWFKELLKHILFFMFSFIFEI